MYRLSETSGDCHYRWMPRTTPSQGRAGIHSQRRVSYRRPSARPREGAGTLGGVPMGWTSPSQGSFSSA